MLQLHDTTPFHTALAVFPNEKGIDTVYVILKATFDIGCRPKIAPQQRPVTFTDTYWDEPGRSSLKYASEAHPAKPATDLILVGEACAPDRQPVPRIDVTMRVADRSKTLRVFGDRTWERGLAGLRMTSPLPFEKIPLTYERAFGGIHESHQRQRVFFEPRNPIGRGFVGKRKTGEIRGLPLPNIEDPHHLIQQPDDQPPPAGYGFIAPAWEPRVSFAGTYDESWRKTRAPFLPVDFDPRFFSMAHPDPICKGHLRGGEPVEIVNASGTGPLRFELPVCEVAVCAQILQDLEEPPLHLETVVFEPGEGLFTMTWRAALVCGKQATKVRQVLLTLKHLDAQM